MKKTETTLVASLFAITVALSPIASFAAGSHSGGHGDMMEFDPTENEFGMYKPGMHVTKVVNIVMGDNMSFTPNMIRVKKGDVIKFVHQNPGQIMHEFVLGTEPSLVDHAAMMRKFPGMEHSEPYMTHVAPGKRGEITWKFSKTGEFSFGCLIPGHFEAGMKGKIIVES